MNLKLEKDGVKLELEYVEPAMIENTMFAFFEFLEGKNFKDSYQSAWEHKKTERELMIEEKARLNREKQLREAEEKKKKEKEKNVIVNKHGIAISI